MNPYNKAINIISDSILEAVGCNRDEAKDIAEDIIINLELNGFLIEYDWMEECNNG